MEEMNELSFDDNEIVPEPSDFFAESNIAGNFAGFEETKMDEENPSPQDPEDDQLF
jgi:hypothetical protein